MLDNLFTVLGQFKMRVVWLYQLLWDFIRIIEKPYINVITVIIKDTGMDIEDLKLKILWIKNLYGSNYKIKKQKIRIMIWV